MSDDPHADDLMALLRELSEVNYRRGVLETRIEWHLHLRDLASQQPPVPKPAAVVPMPQAATDDRFHRRWASGQLELAVLETLDLHKGRTARDIAQRLDANYESVRQVLSKLARKGVVRRLSRGGGFTLEPENDDAVRHA